MGVYYSVVHKTNPVKVLIDGVKQNVYKVKFFCKVQDLDGWGGDWHKKRANNLNLRLESMSASWARSSTEPEFVVNVFDDVCFGEDTVYRVKPGFRGYSDDKPFPGECLGTIVKDGNNVMVKRG